MLLCTICPLFTTRQLQATGVYLFIDNSKKETPRIECSTLKFSIELLVQGQN